MTYPEIVPAALGSATATEVAAIHRTIRNQDRPPPSPKLWPPSQHLRILSGTTPRFTCVTAIESVHALSTDSEKRPELDDVTLGRAQRGDPQAFRDLVELYHRCVFDILWRMVEPVRGNAPVEELTQDTFLRVFRALPAFRPNGPAKLSTWIVTIAVRLALNELRRAPQPEPLEVEVASDNSARPDIQFQRTREREAIRRALGELSPCLRAVFVLGVYEGFDYASIAEILKLAPGTVKSRMSRARAAMQRALQEVHDG